MSGSPTGPRSAGQPPTAITLREAAERLDVHYMTAYRYVRTGRLPAARVNGNWQVQATDVVAMGRPAAARRGTGESSTQAAALLAHCLVEGDEPGAVAVVEGALGSWATPPDVHLLLLGPALCAIGRKWEVGEIPVASEHRASAVAQRVIGRLGPLFVHPGRTRGTVVVGAAPGDLHGIPISMGADLLRNAGFSAIDLGADCPSDAFADAASVADRLLAVGIGYTGCAGDEAELAATVAALRVRLPDVRVVVGGSGMPDGAMASRVGADAWTGGDGRHLVDAVLGTPGGARPS